MPNFAVGLLLLGGGFVVMGWVVNLTGQCIACAVPDGAQARGWAVGAVVFGLLSRGIVGLTVLLALAFLRGQPGAAPLKDPEALEQPQEAAPPARSPPTGLAWVGLASLAAGVVEVVCVSLFLRAVARFFGEKRLARRAGEYARFFATFTALICALNYFSGYILRALPGDLESKVRMVPVVIVMEMVCVLILFAQFLSLVGDTRDAVARSLGKGDSPPAAADPSNPPPPGPG
jgi:hypothetical protein